MIMIFLFAALIFISFTSIIFLVIRNIYFNSIIMNINQGIIIFKSNGKIIKYNKAFLDIYRYERQDIKNIRINDLFSGQKIESLIRDINLYKTMQVNGSGKNKDTIFLNLSLQKLPYFGRQKFLALITDIKNQSSNESKLREGQRLISILMSNLPGLIYLAYFDPDLTLEFVSDGCYELTGYSPSDFINNRRDFMSIVHPDDKNIVIQGRQKAIINKAEFQITYRIITGKNEEKIVWERGKPIFDILHNFVAIGGSINDVTEYREMENKLAEEKERLFVTLRSIGDGVITTDIKGNVVLLNNVAEKLTGWAQEEAMNKHIGEVFHIINENTRVKVANPIDAVLKNGLVVGLANHTALISKDGTERLIADSGAPIKDKQSKLIGVVLVFRDVTEKHKMEMEMSKIIKLESLGVLAGGIAHDFNNILTAILGNINLARFYTSDKKILDLLIEAEKATYNSKSLTDQLLTFAKGGEPVKKIGNINKVLKECVLFSLRGTIIKIEFNLDDNIQLLEFDEGQMNQVFNNLSINARQAMPDGGLLKITSGIFVCDDNQSLIRKGEYLQIIFEDQGGGISKENMQKIFDPFFTTKKEGKGLGLSSCYSIINKHNGYITVESEVNKGSKFFIYLPIIQNPINSNAVLPVKNEEIVSGKGRILFMDDEADIRSYAKKALEFLGYEVELARDGKEAVEIFRSMLISNIRFDCVVLDITIQGGMGGKETLSELKKIDPDIVTIVISGYSNDPVIANYKEYGFTNVLIKPFKIEDLSNVLAKVLKLKK